MKAKDNHPYSKFCTNTVTFHSEKSSHAYAPTHPESVDSHGRRCVTDMTIRQQFSNPFVRSSAVQRGSSLLFSADVGSRPCRHTRREETSPGWLGGHPAVTHPACVAAGAPEHLAPAGRPPPPSVPGRGEVSAPGRGRGLRAPSRERGPARSFLPAGKRAGALRLPTDGHGRRK